MFPLDPDLADRIGQRRSAYNFGLYNFPILIHDWGKSAGERPELALQGGQRFDRYGSH